MYYIFHCYLYFKNMYPISINTFTRSQSSDRHVVPMTLKTTCPGCDNLNTMTFFPQATDPVLQVISGFLECNACGERSKLWLMEPELQSDRTMHLWKEAWMKPAPLDKSSELPTDVDEDFRQDYREAALTLPISPRASAALSRYCLQKLLRGKAGVKPGNLANEIKEVIASQALPSYLAEAIDAVRNYGNFAAHPLENQTTGEIIEVEAVEAEWLLDILRSLIDFYFVYPAQLQRRKDILNNKLSDAGKPTMP
jgi:hypothetical protein